MKRKCWPLLAALLVLLTACAAPQSEETNLTHEQKLSDAVALYREDAPKGLMALTALDAKLLGGKQVRGERCTLGVWQLECGGRHLLLWRLDWVEEEKHPGQLDTLYLTWEGADYYLAEGDGTWSSVRGREEGSVAFNVEDDHLVAGDSTCGAIYLQSPATSFEGWLEHTVDAWETVLATEGNTLTAVTRDVQQVWTLHLSKHEEELP